MEHTPVPAGSIVVGVDGSLPSERAIEWAATQAAAEHRPLVVLHAVQLLGMSQVVGLDAAAVDIGLAVHELGHDDRTLLATAAGLARDVAPDLEIHEVLDESDPRTALLALSRDAAMVVVGSRGRGPVASLLLGSVSVAVSKHAECPVVVVKPGASEEPRSGVVAPVYGDDHDQAVVEFAYAVASLRSLPLTVVHCFWDAAHLDASEREVADDEPGLEDRRRLLAEAVEIARTKFSDVEDRLQLVRGFSDRELVSASAGMDLVVVGSRPAHLLQELVYGSLAPTVVEHAHCSVAVVPVSASGE